MRTRSLLFPIFFGSVVSLTAGCSSSTYPNPILTFNSGQETDTFSDVERFEVKRVNAKGDEKRLLSDDSLPETLDLGNSGTYQFVGTGYDTEDNAVAVGRTLTASPGELLGSEVPMFFARTDRATRPLGSFESTPKQNPVAAILSGRYIWHLDDSSDETVTTDSYNVAYWEHVTPPEQYLEYSCPEVPCHLKNLVVIGGYLTLSIADEWALSVDTYYARASEYAPPSGISSWSEIAGGRTLPGGNDSMILVGPTRLKDPTDAIISFGVDSDGAITMDPFSLATKRAGAAMLFEEGFGLVVAGGSGEGAGVERIESNGDQFVEVPYPADSTVGATLVIEDETHVLRVGGLTTDGQPAPTVRIDVACTKDCAYEPVTELDLALRNAQSFYDPTTTHTLVVGENEDGLTEVYRYGTSGFTPIVFPKSQKRIRALPLELPNQQLAIVGGTDPEDDTASRQDVSVIAF
jgi:hypothetical protein